MMRTFIPKLDVLPPEQKRIWPQLSNAPRLGLTLYGGTAIALRLGHRESMDFDFFTNDPIDRPGLDTYRSKPRPRLTSALACRRSSSTCRTSSALAWRSGRASIAASLSRLCV